MKYMNARKENFSISLFVMKNMDSKSQRVLNTLICFTLHSHLTLIMLKFP